MLQVRLAHQEAEGLRHHARFSEQRCAEAERRRADVEATLELERRDQSQLAFDRRIAEVERRRTEVSNAKEGRQSAAARRLLAQQLEAARRMRSGLEAQARSMRDERRSQVVGYCAELAKWQV